MYVSGHLFQFNVVFYSLLNETTYQRQCVLQCGSGECTIFTCVSSDDILKGRLCGCVGSGVLISVSSIRVSLAGGTCSVHAHACVHACESTDVSQIPVIFSNRHFIYFSFTVICTVYSGLIK